SPWNWRTLSTALPARSSRRLVRRSVVARSRSPSLSPSRSAPPANDDHASGRERRDRNGADGRLRLDCSRALRDSNLRSLHAMKPALPFTLPAPSSERVDVLIIAGEHSGDQHAAAMLRDLRASQPSVQVCALGGPELSAAGAQLLHDLTASSVVGLVEVLKNYSYFKGLLDATLRWIETHRPRAVCFIDYPGFNLRLARELHERGLSCKGGGDIRLLFYISPQIWAWKAGRRFTMAQHLDALAVIFPFEVECYRDTDLDVEFVGHPFLAPGHTSPVRDDPGGPILLLPGSRPQAVRRIFPALLDGYRAAATGRPAVVLYPSDAIRTVLESTRPPDSVELRRGEGEALGASAVLTSSG